METKSKNTFGKLIDITDKNNTDINISFVSHQDVQLNVIQKESKSSDIKDEDNKELTSLLTDIKSYFKKTGVPLNMTQGDAEKNKTVLTGQKPDKASLSDAEIALQKMQSQAQELGAELLLTDRPDIMSEEPWRLPEISPQEDRSAEIPAGKGLAKLAAAIKTVTDTCPLQIELMIQPDLRPQVMMKVSAGEITWIFAAKEGRYPLKDLLAKMAGKTTTHGWDAIVVYQRGQANNLLKQQHIKRFSTGNTLPPVDSDIESSSATRLLTHNLTLSAPHLSFNKPGSGDATAQVAMDFIKGMIVYKEKAAADNYRIMRIEKITPLNSPFVTMDVPLSKSPGSVSEIGEVQFDIKEGDHFTNNLVINGMEQSQISNFFKDRFEKTPPEQRIYKLGTISNYEHQQLQPEEFEIRTMGAPNTASRGSQDEGDGAVVLFVQMKGSDSEPGKTEADWLLADNYTSALVIGNKYLLDNIGYYLALVRFEKYPMGNNVNSLWGARSFKDETGIGNYVPINIEYENERSFPGIEGLTKYKVRGMYNFHLSDDRDVIAPYIIYPDYVPDGDKQLVNTYRMNMTSSTDISITSYDDNNKECISNYTVVGTIELKLDINYRAVVENPDYHPMITTHRDITDNDIDFRYRFIECQPKGDTYLGLDKVIPFTSYIVTHELEEKILSNINAFLIHKGLKYIETFVVENMLFPEENYFHAKTAFIPGDLLVQGQLAPGSESFSVTPSAITIAAGSVYQFKAIPEISGVKWSLSDSEKGNTGADLGTIDAKTGKYTAPQAAVITEGVRHVVVCAKKGDTKVYALASVVTKGVSVSPAYQVVQPGTEVKLTANSVNGGELKWDMGENKQGSSLTKVTNNEYTYKAGKKAAKLNVNLERVTVTDEKGASGEALILIPNSSMSGKITVSYDDVPADSVKLVYTVLIQVPKLDENGDQVYDDDDNPVFEEKEVELTGSKANWTAVETGGATFDKKTGILTSAPGVGDGFAVIRVAYTEGTTQHRSAIVIPLPLSTYKKTILNAYSPEQE